MAERDGIRAEEDRAVRVLLIIFVTKSMILTELAAFFFASRSLESRRGTRCPRSQASLLEITVRGSTVIGLNFVVTTKFITILATFPESNTGRDRGVVI